jgi:hypothetical protein
MDWTKQGLIYSARGQHFWNKTHASVPTLDMISDKVWRIYFASRDEHNRSFTSFIEVEAGNPKKILYEHPEPILPLGKLGTFDDSGVMPSSIVNVGAEKYLYYIGWALRRTVPFHNGIGLAISRDGGRTFERFSDGPLFGSTYLEPYFASSPCVLRDDDIWRCWYLSCTRWEVIDGRPEAFYHLKYAESENGIDWERKGIVAIDYKTDTEAGISQPSVLKEAGLYKMWYSYRAASGYRTERDKSYRIGYAESHDAKHWIRMDEAAGIDVSEHGWDSEMIEYPHVIVHGNEKYMFYNGNGFGASGFGYATANSL